MKILLFCIDVVNSSMAGPAIRYWELAKALAKHHEVVLSIPNIADISSPDFQISSRLLRKPKLDIGEADIMITQVITPRIALHAKRYGTKIILDAYAPSLPEGLELYKPLTKRERDHRYSAIVDQLNFSFQIADCIICANTRQRDLWIGTLMNLGRIKSDIYDRDPTLDKLINVVPFGLPSDPPKREGKGLREIFNLKNEDIVLLWGGGIWNWFDPLTLIKAVKNLNEEGIPIRLVFMGLKHPNKLIPEMKMSADAVQLAKTLGIIDKSVFFNYGWTPYQQRQNFLLDADIGVSTHSMHMETRYAFRTRILDYLWAGLPIISTEGDCFQQLIESEKLGKTVPSGDVKALEKAIRDLANDREKLISMRNNIAKVRPQFYWSTISETLLMMIKELSVQPKSGLGIKDLLLIGSICRKKINLTNFKKFMKSR